METVTEQPIKKIEFFRRPQSLPGVAPLTKKPEDTGYEIGISGDTVEDGEVGRQRVGGDGVACGV